MRVLTHGYHMSFFFSTRRLVAKGVLLVIFGLLVLSFALWGTGDLLRGRVSTGSIAQVGDLEITRGEFYRAWNNQAVDPGGRRGRQQAESALRVLVDGSLVGQETERLALQIGREDLENVLAEFEPFQDVTGAFDPLRFQTFLRNSGFDEREFAERFGRDVVAQRLQESLLSGVRAPVILSEALVAHEETERTARYIRVVADEDLPAPLSDTELEAYYEEVKEGYRSYEFRRVSWLWISPENLEADLEATESQLRTRYDEELETRFTVAAERSFRQEVLPDEEAALARIEELKILAEELAAAPAPAGPDLSGLTVTDEDGNPIEGITFAAPEAPPPVLLDGQDTLGPLPANEMVAEVAVLLFAEGQEIGLVETPVESPFGWHVLEVVSVVAGSETSFEDARADLEAELLRGLALDGAAEEANRLDDALGRGLGLEDVALELGLEVLSGRFNRFGSDEDGETLEGLPSDGGMRAEVFATTDLNTTGLLSESRDLGGYYSFRVEDISPRADRVLEGELREQILERNQEERRGQETEARADAIADRVRAGETLETIAAAEELEVLTSDSLKREAQYPFRNFALSLFGLAAEGQDAVSVAPLERDFAVLQLDSSAPPDLDSEETRSAIQLNRARLQNEIVNELYEQYLDALREQYPVKINREQLDLLLQAQGHQ